MLTVDDYARIRRAYRDGMSLRAIARTFHHTRRTIREALENPEPKPYTRTGPPAAPKLDPFKAVIDEILAADEQAPRKQRHTATRIHRRLVAEHGYQGGYDQVRRYIGSKRRRERETFIPLDHDPGRRAEADFGHIHVDFPDGRRLVPVLIVTWAFSYRAFAIALPTERTEAILHGLVEAFASFGCVPKELWWDNPTTVAVEVLKGRERRVNERYKALASHYNFEPLFCMPARGNEKPHAENRVKDLERRWATPVPRVRDLAELNGHLRRCCLDDQDRAATGQADTIADRFERDRAAAIPLPERPFDACLTTAAKVDKYQAVRFDNVSYSVPRSQAFQAVTVKAYVDRIAVVAAGQVVARHARSYERGAMVLDPLHYLTTLSRKPACLDHAPVYRDWMLPPAFAELRRSLEIRHGPFAGARQFIRVLLLLDHHPQERVERALLNPAAGEAPSADAVILRVHRLRDKERSRPADVPDSPVEFPSALTAIRVPVPDLSRFNQFLSLGGPSDVRPFVPVAQVEPEAAPAADDRGRVREAGP
jgi:transposase